MAEEKMIDKADREKFELERYAEANAAPVITAAVEPIDNEDEVEVSVEAGEEKEFETAEMERAVQEENVIKFGGSLMLEAAFESKPLVRGADNEGEEPFVVSEEKEAKSSMPEENMQEADVIDNFFKDEKPREFKLRGMRRHSSFGALGYNKDNVSSRYLKPPAGSCHDFCKFGHKNVLEEKAKTTPFSRVISDRGFITPNEFGVKGKKKKIVRRLSFPESITEKEEKLCLKEPEVSGMPNSNMPNSKLKAKKVEDLRKYMSSSKVFEVPKPVVWNPKPARSSIPKLQEIKTGLGEKKSATLESSSPSSKPQLKKSRSIIAKIYRDFRASTYSKSMGNRQEAKAKKPEVPEKTLHMIEHSGNAKAKGASPRDPYQSKKLQKTQGASRSEGQTLRVPKTNKPTKKEKSQHSIKETGDSGNVRDEQIEPVMEAGKCKDNSPKAKSPRSKTPKSKSCVEPKATAKKVGTNQSGEKEGSIWKLKFRRGTIVSLPNVISSPRKLRFRKTKSLTENHVEDGINTSLKNNEVNGDLALTPPVSEKVVLRHQEGPEKKDNVDWNNVIEETAGQLVKTKKSKVKALVGAFETVVMSLGDRKTRLSSGSA